MNQTHPVGRPLLLNKPLINRWCRAAEDEILPGWELCNRFNIFYQTYWNWIETGKACKNEPTGELTKKQALCVELETRLQSIYAKHEQTLIQNLQNPETRDLARLVMCLKPDFAFVEAAAL